MSDKLCLQLLFEPRILVVHHTGVCQGRNRGLTVATGDVITYLDDDNTFKPDFVAETLALFENNPQVNYSMPIQQRRRDVVQDGAIVSSSKEFFSPTLDCTIEQLIRHEQLIDSNGFAHRNNRDLSLMWNPDFRIYIDYEFLLRCINHWGRSSFKLNPVVIVDYVQTNLGIIGSSNYQDWTNEIDWIVNHQESYTCLNDTDIQALNRLKDEYRSRHQKIESIKAFTLLS